MRAITRLVTLLLLLYPATGFVLADDTPPEVADAVEPSLPTAFTKATPEGLSDLRAMQDHIATLIDRLTECTVGLQIGPAQGSGVIVSGDGYVLTAGHVSGRPGRSLKVVLSDGTRVDGVTLGRNQTLDAGLVRIEGDRTDWPHVEMAEFDSINEGDWCIATGHPGGYQEGRAPVFRLGRVIFNSRRVVQSDCELVGGDSGGPLFDMHGRVIGINSRIGEHTTRNFHVPISAYHDDWDRLADSETFFTHSGALLGISGQPHEQGIEITTVHAGDPAEEAGVRVGDVLVTFGGRPVRDIDQLYDLVGKRRPGRPVQIEIIRNGQKLDLTVTLGMRWD